MKITINAKDLSTALSRIAAVAPRRTTIPIIEMLAFSVSGTSLKITATSLDIEASVTVPCETESEGAAAVHASLSAVVKSMGKRDISLEMVDARLNVTGGRNAYDFATLPIADFPIMDETTDDPRQAFVIAANDLRMGMALHIFDRVLQEIDPTCKRLIVVVPGNGLPVAGGFL